jgi:RimJ/RimL family protein N-acetyltransferase
MDTQTKPIISSQGHKVYLRPIDERNIETFLRWINDRSISRYLESYLPVTERGEQAWFESVVHSQNNILFSIVTLDGVLIGNTGLMNIKWNDRVGFTGTMIGEKEFWGKGYGTDSKMLLLDYAFNVLNMRKICSSTYAFNDRSLASMLKCGFQEEGRRRLQVYREGEYYDEIMVGVFKEEWLPLWEKYKAEKTER